MKFKILPILTIFLFFLVSVYAADYGTYGANTYGIGKYGFGEAAPAVTTTTASSSGGAGGGGGSSTTQPTTTSTVIDTPAGGEADFSFDGKLAIDRIIFVTSLGIVKGKMTVSEVTSASIQQIVGTLVGENVFKYYNIKPQNFDESAVSGNIKITFDVNVNWVATHGMTKDDVALYRYNDGKWNQLTTNLITEGTRGYHYESETPGFSYFAIGQKALVGQKPTPPTAPTTTPTGEAVAPPQEVQPSVPGPSKGRAISPVTTAVIVVAVIVLLAVAIYFGFVRKKDHR